MPREGREEGGPEEGRAAGAAGLVDEPVGAGAAGRQGQAPPRPQSGPQEEGGGSVLRRSSDRRLWVGRERLLQGGSRG